MLEHWHTVISSPREPCGPDVLKMNEPLVSRLCVHFVELMLYVRHNNCDCLFELMLYVPVNSKGHFGMLPPFYGTFTQH